MVVRDPKRPSENEAEDLLGGLFGILCGDP